MSSELKIKSGRKSKWKERMFSEHSGTLCHNENEGPGFLVSS